MIVFLLECVITITTSRPFQLSQEATNDFSKERSYDHFIM